MAKEKLAGSKLILHHRFRQLICHDSFCVGLMISRRRKKNVVTKNIKTKSKPLHTEDCLESEGKVFCRFRETRHKEVSVQLGFPLVSCKSGCPITIAEEWRPSTCPHPTSAIILSKHWTPKTQDFCRNFTEGEGKGCSLVPAREGTDVPGRLGSYGWGRTLM